jgi:hypothetical protein
MPPPALMGAPMPCAAPPVPNPMAGPFPGTTPAYQPMTFLAEPMPLYAPCCAAPAPAAAHYLVETKLMRTCSGSVAVNSETLSRCMLAEGAQAEIALRGQGCCVQPGQPAAALGVCVARAGKNKVGVELALECCHAEKCGKGGERMQCDCARVCRTVKLGKPTHFVLRKNSDGAEETWAEVTVTEAPPAGPERLAKAPRPVPAACPVAGAVAGVAAALGEMCGCRAAAAATTLPSGHYLRHPPQYVPPAPAFPLTRELVAQQAVPVPPPFVGPCVGMVVPSPLPVLPPPTPARPAAGSVVRAVCEDGMARLEVRGGGAPCLKCKSLVLEAPHGDAVKLTAGKGRVVISGPDLKASADRVRTAGGDRLVLEGHVRLACRREGHETHVKADHLEMSLEGEHVEVKPAAPAAE